MARPAALCACLVAMLVVASSWSADGQMLPEWERPIPRPPPVVSPSVDDATELLPSPLDERGARAAPSDSIGGSSAGDTVKIGERKSRTDFETPQEVTGVGAGLEDHARASEMKRKEEATGTPADLKKDDAGVPKKKEKEEATETGGGMEKVDVKDPEKKGKQGAARTADDKIMDGGEISEKEEKEKKEEAAVTGGGAKADNVENPEKKGEEATGAGGAQKKEDAKAPEQRGKEEATGTPADLKKDDAGVPVEKGKEDAGVPVEKGKGEAIVTGDVENLEKKGKETTGTGDDLPKDDNERAVWKEEVDAPADSGSADPGIDDGEISDKVGDARKGDKGQDGDVVPLERSSTVEIAFGSDDTVEVAAASPMAAGRAASSAGDYVGVTSEDGYTVKHLVMIVGVISSVLVVTYVFVSSSWDSRAPLSSNLSNVRATLTCGERTVYDPQTGTDSQDFVDPTAAELQVPYGGSYASSQTVRHRDTALFDDDPDLWDRKKE